MPNTSATGGPLVPASSPPYGAALCKIIQNWLVPLVGLAGDHVVVYDQPEPPNIPEAGDAWAAVRVSIGPADTFPFVGHSGGQDTLQRHERLDILMSFYDLGVTGTAQFYMAQCRDGLAIAQNLEPLYSNAMGLVSVGEPVTVPTLLKIRWLYRVDLPFAINRQVSRVYPVLDLLIASVDLRANVEAPPELITRSIPVR